MKKIIYAVPALTAAAAFAGETASSTWYEDAASTAQSDLTAIAATLGPMVAAVVCVVAGCRLVAKLINRAVGK